MKKIIIITLLTILLIQNAYALGITPARTTINFEPNLNQEFTVTILNNQNKETRVDISLEGNLKQHISLEKNTVTLKPNENKKLNFKVNLPEKIEKPGNHDIEIVITEIPLEPKSTQTTVQAAVSVSSQIRIKIPYPGKYAEADLEIYSLDDKVFITIPIFNLGQETIKPFANIKILQQDKKLADITTNPIELNSKQNKKIKAEWDAPSIGKYKVTAKVFYANKEIDLEKEFLVGDIFIKIIDLKFGKFKLKEIVKLDIIIKNGWNEIINNVYSEVFIKNQKGITVSNLKTPSFNINPLEEKTLTAYWDTKDIIPGIYDIIIKLNYNNKKSEKTIQVDVQEDSITKTTELRPMPSPIKPNKTILILSIIILIILAILVFIYLKTREK